MDLAPDALANNDLADIAGRKAQWREWYSLAVTNCLRFRAFENSDAMKLYRSFGPKKIYNDFLIGFLLQCEEVPHARLTPVVDPEMIVGFSASGNLDEGQRNAGEFLDTLNRFYIQIAFDRYLGDHRKHYKMIQADVARNLPSGPFVSVMEAFYGKKFDHYCLVPSLDIPTSMGFGKLHKGANTIYNAFGPFGFQSFDESHLHLAFDDAQKIRELSVHEFGHSFVNPAIDKVPANLIHETERLYDPVKKQMTEHAYPTWTICLYEHFVRAGEIVIAGKLGHAADAQRMLQENVKTGFIYLPAIVAELERFDRESGEARDYDGFVPLVIAKLAKTP